MAPPKKNGPLSFIINVSVTITLYFFEREKEKKGGLLMRSTELGAKLNLGGEREGEREVKKNQG